MTTDVLCAKFDELITPTALALSGAEVAARLEGFHQLESIDDFLEPFLAAM
jgi:hypothetical protein